MMSRILSLAETNPLFIGSTLVRPYYFSFATAAFFLGLSTQASAIVYIATNSGVSRRLIRDGREYRLVVQPEQKFFGAVKMDAYGCGVMMAEPEKTIVDCLDRPTCAGGVPEIATMLWRGKNRLSWNQLVGYAVRFKSCSLIQRLGYLVDALRLPIDTSTRDLMVGTASGSICYLGRRSQWKTVGEYNSTWRVVDNIPRRVLLGDIEVY
jgi:predicted transcriptional regulator of viral defense system